MNTAGEKTTNVLKRYNVQFIDDYAVITVTSVEGSDDDMAVDNATKLMADYYGINVSNWLLGEVQEIGN